MTDNWNADGPIVVWENFGYDGWQPRSYPTLAKALATARISRNHVVTRLIDVTGLIDAVCHELQDREPQGGDISPMSQRAKHVSVAQSDGTEHSAPGRIAANIEEPRE